jgi:hypothetical protein
MADELISFPVAVFGAGAWFAQQIMQPTIKALGENIQAYLGSRISRVFATSEQIAKASDLKLNPIAPGLLTRMIMDASFSADEEEITEWWAHLFVDASVQGSNQHAVFSDIMALLGPVEVRCLDEFVKSCLQFEHSGFGDYLSSNMNDTNTGFESAVQNRISQENAADRYDEIVSQLLQGTYGWPIRPTEWRLPRKDGESEIVGFGFDSWSRDRRLPLGILQRAGILQPLLATFSAWGSNTWVRANGLTPLGYEFYRACNGLIPSETN